MATKKIDPHAALAKLEAVKEKTAAKKSTNAK